MNYWGSFLSLGSGSPGDRTTRGALRFANGLSLASLAIASAFTIVAALTTGALSGASYLALSCLFGVSLYLAYDERSLPSRMLSLVGVNLAVVLFGLAAPIGFRDLGDKLAILCAPLLLLPPILLPELSLARVRRLSMASAALLLPAFLVQPLQDQLTASPSEQPALLGAPVGYIVGGVALALTYLMGQMLLRRCQAFQSQAEYAANERNRLAGILGHDVANNLAVIQGSLKLLERDLQLSRTVQGKRYYERALKSFDYLSRVIDQIRAGQSWDEETLELVMEPLSIAEISAYLEFVFEDKLDAKGIHLTIENHLDQDDQIRCEPARFLNSVLSNIVSNACKYSHPGGTILMTFGPTTDQYGIITIKDHGIGMSVESQQELFCEASPPSVMGTAGEPEGAGLGLKIARAQVRRQQGRFFIESTPDQGTTVTLQMPMVTAAVKPLSNLSA